jgi:hypothetical protein
MRRWLEYTPRGDSLDSIWLRARTWRVVARALPAVLPWGRRPLGRDLRRQVTATGAPLLEEHAFCEPLQIVYEYGVLGLAGLVAWGALTVPHLRAGDPFSTALVVYGLAGCGSISWRTWPFPVLGALLTLGVVWP